MNKYHMPGLKKRRLKWWQLFVVIGLIIVLWLFISRVAFAQIVDPYGMPDDYVYTNNSQQDNMQWQLDQQRYQQKWMQQEMRNQEQDRLQQEEIRKMQENMERK